MVKEGERHKANIEEEPKKVKDTNTNRTKSARNTKGGATQYKT